MKPLTKKQQEVFDFVIWFKNEYGVSPVYKDIMVKFNIDASAAHYRCRNFRHLMNSRTAKVKMTEDEFIHKFKEAGFELYKTEDLKPKLDFYYATCVGAK